PVFLDNPAGTQVPQSVVDAMSDCLLQANANLGGYFETSRRADAVMADARSAMADLLNAPSPDEIVFGQNMTTITFHLSRAIGRWLREGDEIILSRMDHDANVSPWVLMAKDMGLTVRWLDFDTDTYEFDLKRLQMLITDRTRLVCVGLASNVLGTINDVRAMAALAHEANALIYVDAVHYAPHGQIDVQALDLDFLVCSAYKFFGPHQGILWGRSELLADLEPYRLRPAAKEPPGSYETGTQSHEGIAGVTAAVDYLATLGNDAGDDRRAQLARAMYRITAYESTLRDHLLDELAARPSITVHGITAPERRSHRVPTVSFTADSLTPPQLAQGLAERGICCWDGHSYAVEPIGALGLMKSGGVLRVGMAHYNTIEEVDRLLGALSDLL
ncbi:MAG: cysteine desulfurase-like protein, partial [Pseudomonadota bacterium]